MARISAGLMSFECATVTANSGPSSSAACHHGELLNAAEADQRCQVYGQEQTPALSSLIAAASLSELLIDDGDR
jgi:hypothetical protein